MSYNSKVIAFLFISGSIFSAENGNNRLPLIMISSDEEPLIQINRTMPMNDYRYLSPARAKRPRKFKSIPTEVKRKKALTQEEIKSKKIVSRMTPHVLPLPPEGRTYSVLYKGKLLIDLTLNIIKKEIGSTASRFSHSINPNKLHELNLLIRTLYAINWHDSLEKIDTIEVKNMNSFSSTELKEHLHELAKNSHIQELIEKEYGPLVRIEDGSISIQYTKNKTEKTLKTYLKVIKIKNEEDSAQVSPYTNVVSSDDSTQEDMMLDDY
jgi:hypothetical protein